MDLLGKTSDKKSTDSPDSLLCHVKFFENLFEDTVETLSKMDCPLDSYRIAYLSPGDGLYYTYQQVSFCVKRQFSQIALVSVHLAVLPMTPFCQTYSWCCSTIKGDLKANYHVESTPLYRS